jgi:hypothetical protein
MKAVWLPQVTRCFELAVKELFIFFILISSLIYVLGRTFALIFPGPQRKYFQEKNSTILSFLAVGSSCLSKTNILNYILKYLGFSHCLEFLLLNFNYDKADRPPSPDRFSFTFFLLLSPLSFLYSCTVHFSFYFFQFHLKVLSLLFLLVFRVLPAYVFVFCCITIFSVVKL